MEIDKKTYGRLWREANKERIAEKAKFWRKKRLASMTPEQLAAEKEKRRIYQKGYHHRKQIEKTAKEREYGKVFKVKRVRKCMTFYKPRDEYLDTLHRSHLIAATDGHLERLLADIIKGNRAYVGGA